jgi:hypothetical protein
LDETKPILGYANSGPAVEPREALQVIELRRPAAHAATVRRLGLRKLGRSLALEPLWELTVERQWPWLIDVVIFRYHRAACSS